MWFSFICYPKVLLLFGESGWAGWFGFISVAFGMVFGSLAGLAGLASFQLLLVWFWTQIDNSNSPKWQGNNWFSCLLDGSLTILVTSAFPKGNETNGFLALGASSKVVEATTNLQKAIKPIVFLHFGSFQEP